MPKRFEPLSLSEVLTNPLANSSESLFLHQSLREQIKSSFLALLLESQRALNENFQSIINLLNSLDETHRFSPLFYFYYFSLLEAMYQQDEKNVKKICLRLSTHENNDFYQDEFIIDNKITNPIIKFYREHQIKDSQRQETFKKLNSREYDTAKKYIFQVLDILKQLNNNLFQEINHLISTIHISKGEFVATASSSMKFFGMILLRYTEIKPEKNLLLYFFDLIVHEAAHIYLNLFMALDPIVLNSKEFYFSPARNTTRPMKGIFHAHFVFFRLLISYRSVKSFFASNVPEPCADLQATSKLPLVKLPLSYETRLQIYEYKFRQGEEIIKKHAKLSNIGMKLFHNMSDLVK